MVPPRRSPRGLNIALWIAQALVGTPFILFGLMKLTRPISHLVPMMPWTGQLPEAVVRGLGLVDLAGGLGLLLPGITGVRRRLARVAAIGSIGLQISASGFHLSRGEGAMVPLNIIFLALLLFIVWGGTRAPLAAHRGAWA